LVYAIFRMNIGTVPQVWLFLFYFIAGCLISNWMQGLHAAEC